MTIADNRTRSQSWRVRALREAREHDQPLEARASEPHRGIQPAERRRRFVRIDLRVALVGRDDEAVPVGALEDRAPVVE